MQTAVNLRNCSHSCQVIARSRLSDFIFNFSNERDRWSSQIREMLYILQGNVKLVNSLLTPQCLILVLDFLIQAFTYCCFVSLLL